MGKMKYFLFTVFCVMVISTVTACGRDGGTGNHMGNDRKDNNSATESSYQNEETGGVLRDMVDDVERGVERMTE